MAAEVSKTLDPPKSSLKKRALIGFFPLFKEDFDQVIPSFLRGTSAVLGSPQMERLVWAKGDLDRTVDLTNIL